MAPRRGPSKAAHSPTLHRQAAVNTVPSGYQAPGGGYPAGGGPGCTGQGDGALPILGAALDGKAEHKVKGLGV